MVQLALSIYTSMLLTTHQFYKRSEVRNQPKMCEHLLYHIIISYVRYLDRDCELFQPFGENKGFYIFISIFKGLRAPQNADPERLRRFSFHGNGNIDITAQYNKGKTTPQKKSIRVQC